METVVQLEAEPMITWGALLLHPHESDKQICSFVNYLQAFLERHKSQPSLVAEDNDAMKDSYLRLEEMRYAASQILELWKRPGDFD